VKKNLSFKNPYVATPAAIEILKDAGFP